MALFTLQEVSDLIFRAPDGREVELIRSERQLRDAAELIVRRFGNLDAKLKSFDEILQGERLLAELLPLRVFLIHPGAVAIFLGRARVIERPDMIQETKRTIQRSAAAAASRRRGS